MANLMRQGYQVYLPRFVKSFRCGGQLRDRVLPLFPRYLFVRLIEGRQPLGPMRSTVGVAGVVRFGAGYAVVPDHVIQALWARADESTGLHRLSVAPKLTNGASVRVTAGPFEGVEGVFQREAGADRVVVLLRLLGQEVPVCVPAECVRPDRVA